jgi:O-antigen/teichoic acid export membrane protein
MTSDTLRSTLGIFLTRVGVLPLVFASAVLVARALTPEERGSYALMLLFAGLWLPIFSFGQWGSISYFVGSRRYAVRDVAVTTSLFSLLIGGIVICVVSVLWTLDALGGIARSLPFLELTLMLCVLPFQAMQQAHVRLLEADAKYRKASIFKVIGVLLFLGLLLAGLVVLPMFSGWQQENKLRVIVVCYSLSQVLVSVLQAAAILRAYQPVWQWQKAYLGESFHYGWRVWWGDITARLNLRGDQLLLSYFVADEELGVYAIAIILAEMLWNIPDSLTMVLFNRLAANRDLEARAELVERVHRLLLTVMGLLALLTALIVPYLVTWIFGEKYAGAMVPLWLLLPGTVFLTSAKVLTKYFSSAGHPGLSSLVTMGGMLAGLTSCAVMLTLYPEMGIKTAAIASSIGYLLTMFLSVGIYGALRGGITRSLFIPRADDLTWIRLHLRVSNRTTQP